MELNSLYNMLRHKDHVCRGVSKAVAKAVMLCAKQDGHMHNDSAQKAVSKGDAVFDAWVDVQMSKPGYTTATYAP